MAREGGATTARALTVALLALLLAPSLAPAAAQATAPAQWWGSTGMNDGWHIRVPITVTNPLDREVRDVTVGKDIDLAALLVQAGWNSGASSSGRRLQSFELDEASVRVVEYRSLRAGEAGAGVIVGEVASFVRYGALEGLRSYHNRTAPDLHVEWMLPGTTAPHATRSFMVYLDVLANGKKPVASYDEAAAGPLAGRYWISRGTTLYGVAARLVLLGLEDDTLATIDVYQSGRPQTMEGSAADGVENPVRLSRGSRVEIPIGTDPLAIRIRATKPVAAVGNSTSSGLVFGPVPSMDSGLMGREFVVPPSNLFFVLPGTSPSTVRWTGGAAEVTRGAPFAKVPQGSFDAVPAASVSATQPILAMALPREGTKTQFPTLWGGSAGSRLPIIPSVTNYLGDVACARVGGRGEVVVFGDEGGHARVVDLATGAAQHPAASNGEPTGKSQRISASEAWRVPSTLPARCLSEVRATVGEGETRASAAKLRALSGDTAGRGDDAVLTPWGGVAATLFDVTSPAQAVAYYDATEVVITSPGSPSRRVVLSEGDLVDVAGSASAPSRIVASRPLAVLPTRAGGFFAGLDGSLVVQVAGPAEYRGYLMSLEPAVGAEPLVLLAAPGKEARATLLARNLAKDQYGAPVADVATFQVPDAAAGWTASLSASSARLAGGASTTVELRVTPPADAAAGTRLVIPVDVASQGNPAMTDRVQVVVLVRASYAVDLWYDKEHGPRAKTFTLDEGATATTRVVVKNLATTPDDILLKATSLSDKWPIGLGEDRTRLLQLSLGPGESREVALTITAPTGEKLQSALEIEASSLSDAAVGAKVTGTLRIRADLRMALVANETSADAPPGGVAVFDARFQNRGQDRIGIQLAPSGTMPDGWGPVEILHKGERVDELLGLLPGADVPLQVRVPVPANASRWDAVPLRVVARTVPQFVGDPVLVESLDLVAIASAQHALTVTAPPANVEVDADGSVTLSAQLANAGNGEESVRIVPVGLPPGTSLVVSAPVDVPVGGRDEFAVVLKTSAPPGRYPATLRVETEDGHVQAWETNVTVPQRRAADLSWAAPARALVGLRSALLLDVKNTGNVPLALPPEVQLPDGWRSTLQVQAAALPPGGTARVGVSLMVPAGTPTGSASLALAPAYANATGLPLAVETVALTAAQEPTEARAASVRIANGGTGEARDVEVTLTREGEVVDRVVLQRVPPGGDALAVLAFPDDGGTLALTVDAKGAYGEPLRMDVDAPSKSLLPGPGLAVVAAALVAMALARRRR